MLHLEDAQEVSQWAGHHRNLMDQGKAAKSHYGHVNGRNDI
jgi:hypothetical protein